MSWRPDDGVVRMRLRALASARRCFDYHRPHILKARNGLYREKVASLTQAIMAEGDAATMKSVGRFIDEIRLVPESDANRIELHGELSATLGLAGRSNSKSPSMFARALSEQVKLVAGTGFEPVTFRL